MIWFFVVNTALLLFVLDMWLSHVFAVPFLYVGVVLLSAWLPQTRETVVATTMCCILVVLGSYISNLDEPSFYDAVNRTAAVSLLWVTALASVSGERIGRRAEKRMRTEAQFHERLLRSRAYLREERIKKEAAQRQALLRARAEASQRAAVVAAQEREQRRVAKELHDGLGQRIAVITMIIDRMEKSVGLTTSGLLRDLRAEFIHVITELRTLAHALQPATLEYLGLQAALEEECERLSNKTPMKVAFSASPLPSDLSTEVSTCLFRITQEALCNALNHGRASRAIVRIFIVGDYVRLLVRDFGCGFDVTEDPPKGLGLLSMRERTALVGGTFHLTSKPKKGTIVDVKVPWSHRHEPKLRAFDLVLDRSIE